MAIAFVQDDTTVNDPSPATIVMGSNVTAGNLMLVGMMGLNTSGTTPTVTDTLSNTYTVRVAIDYGSHRIWIFTAENITGGSCTITITLSSVTFDAAVAAEYSGLATSSATDQTASATGTGTDATFNTGTTTQANELVVGFFSSGASSFTVGSGFTERQNFGSSASHIYEDKIVSAVGVQEIDAVQLSSVAWGGVGATFKEAGGGQRFFVLSRF